MVSSITKLVLIGGGLTIAAGLAYFTYQYMSSDTLGGQLARSRFGLDEPPSIRSLLNKEADPTKPLSQQPKDRINQLVDRIIENITKSRDAPIPEWYTKRSNAAFYNDMSLEEEKYEPWALQH